MGMNCASLFVLYSIQSPSGYLFCLLTLLGHELTESTSLINKQKTDVSELSPLFYRMYDYKLCQINVLSADRHHL